MCINTNLFNKGKKILLPLCFVSLALGASLPAAAVVASPDPVEVTQPDGSKLRVRIMGDERFSYYLSMDGRLLVNNNGAFYYATPDSDGLPVASAALAKEATAAPVALSAASVDSYSQSMIAAKYKRTSDSGIMRNKRLEEAAGDNAITPGIGLFDHTFPAYGKKKCLVILVSYSNRDFFYSTLRGGDAYDYFYRMLNEEGFNDNGATGSARDYFVENSNGQFEPEFDVFGPVQLSRPYSYYGAQTVWANDAHPAEMVAEACKALDDKINFAEYDHNGDGYVDNVFVIYAGLGQASSSDPNTIWPHQWNISYSGETAPPILDGVFVDQYGCINEWNSQYNRPDAIGTFVHEFSHVMGLPDLYVTNYNENAFTPRAWSVLDYGPYNNQGRTPPAYSIFERNALGWCKPTPFTDGEEVELGYIGDTNEGRIVYTERPEEIFLFENRQKTRWDEYIYGHGMLVWHIDYNKRVWNQNAVNNTTSHQYVDLIEADGLTRESDRDGDPFPGEFWVDEFSPTTKPALRSWAGNSCGVWLSNIDETDDGRITFNVKTDEDVIASGVKPVLSAEAGLRVNGRTISLNGAASALVYDSMGRLVANLSGNKTVTLSAAGVYVVRTPEGASKFMIK